MPTKKPRVMVTLEPEVYEALKELQAAADISPASFISQMLKETLPAIHGMAKASVMAKRRNLDAFELLQEQLMEATEKASQVNLDLQQTKTKLRRAKGYGHHDHG